MVGKAVEVGYQIRTNTGLIAKAILDVDYSLQVLKSQAGYYIGTRTPEGMPAGKGWNILNQSKTLNQH